MRDSTERLRDILEAIDRIEKYTTYEDLERDDLLAVLTFATRLSQIKRMELIGV